MKTKSKKQASTTSGKKKLTVNKQTLRDLSGGEKGQDVRGGGAKPNVVGTPCGAKSELQ